MRFHHPLTRIDLGGVVKEYAVDCAVSVIRAMGIRRGLVNLGGDLRVIGPVPADKRPFRVGLAHPRRHRETIGTITLRDGAIVSAGDYQSYFIRDGRRYHHILDPRTGWPLELCYSGVTAHGNTAQDALFATKRLFLRKKPIASDEKDLPRLFVACDSGGDVARYGSCYDLRFQPAQTFPGAADKDVADPTGEGRACGVCDAGRGGEARIGGSRTG